MATLLTRCASSSSRRAAYLLRLRLYLLWPHYSPGAHRAPVGERPARHRSVPHRGAGITLLTMPITHYAYTHYACSCYAYTHSAYTHYAYTYCACTFTMPSTLSRGAGGRGQHQRGQGDRDDDPRLGDVHIVSVVRDDSRRQGEQRDSKYRLAGIASMIASIASIAGIVSIRMAAGSYADARPWLRGRWTSRSTTISTIGGPHYLL